jgi:hypothetical protein
VLYFYILFWYCCVALYVDFFFSHATTAGVLEPFSPLAIFTPEKWLCSHLFSIPYQGGKWLYTTCSRISLGQMDSDNNTE